MFGKLGFVNIFTRIVFLFLLLVSSWAYAQKKPTVPTSQKATIKVESAVVYKKPDFDAAILTSVPQGKVYVISKTTKGAFYKIRVKKGQVGWIADSDLKLGVHKNLTPKKTVQMPKNLPPATDDEFMPFEDFGDDPEVAMKQSFLGQRYRGFTVENVRWTESTMQATRSEDIIFIGAAFSGYNTLITGDLYITSNILFTYGAPKFYKSATGNPATGFIFKPNFLFETVFKEKKNYLLYYGFGPSFTYSHFDTSITVNDRNEHFVVDNMTIGPVFSFGGAYRIGTFSPRLELKYYWERQQYFGLNVALLTLF